MSDDNDIFEKYLDKKKGLADFLKEPRSWVIIVTTLAVIFTIFAIYKFVIVDRMGPQEVKNSIQVLELDSKWVESEGSEGGIKIVPSITFKIKNTGKRPLHYVTLEGIFQFEEPGNKTYFDGVAQVCKEPLQPGEVTGEIYIKTFNGYTASSKQAFLQNKENWKKMNVKIFAKTSGSGPVAIVDKYPVKQVIEGMEDLQGYESDAEKERLAQNTDRVAKSIQITWNETKWLDRKITSKEAVIVPSIKIKIKNLSQAALQDIIFKGMFVFSESGEWLSDGLTTALKDPLPPGETSDEILIKADHGYTASSKAAFVKNREHWKRVVVRVFAKAPDSGYALIGTYPVSREIQGIRVRYHYREKQ